MTRCNRIKKRRGGRRNALAALTPSALRLGVSPRTGDRVDLDLGRFKTNVYLKAPTGGGKTSVLSRIPSALAFAPNPMWSYDFIGTGFDEVENFVAFVGTVLKLYEKIDPDAGLRIADPFLSRYAFLKLSNRSRTATGINLPVRIDLLKRRYLFDRWESTAEVVERVVRIFDLRFQGDMGIRVQFQRVATAVIATLASAGMPLKRWEEVLSGGDVMEEVRRAQELYGTAKDPYVQTQLRELLRIQALKTPKSTRDFDLATNSTRNALSAYLPGTLLGELFADETFDPASVIFGGNRLFVSTDIADTLLRRETFLALYALEGALVAARFGRVHRFARLLRFIDEIAWLPHSIADDLAQVRNLGVTVILAHQASAQWRQLGMPHIADMIGSLFPTQIVFRPATMEEAKDLVIASTEIDPAGMILERYVTSRSIGKAVTDTITDSWQESFSEQVSESHSLATPESRFGDDAPPRFTSTDGRSTGSGRSSGSGGSTGQALSSSETEGVAQVLMRIPFDEQVSLAAQKYMRRPQYEATLIEDGRGRDVRLDPPVKFPRTLLGVDIRGFYDHFHDAFWESKFTTTAPVIPLISAPDVRPAEASSPTFGDDSPVIDIVPERPPADLQSDAELQSVDGDNVAPQREMRPTPASSMSDPTSTRVIALHSAVWLRHTTAQQLMLLDTSCTYDAAIRALDRLVKVGALACVRPPAPTGSGSTPRLFQLTESGARLAAELGIASYEPALRLARSVLAQKRAIEEGSPTLVRHQRFVGWLLALLIAYIRTKDPEAVFETVLWDPAIKVDLGESASALSVAARKRLNLAEKKTEATYRPDALMLVRWTPGPETPMRLEPFAIEIETSFGEQPQSVIGEAKAVCIAAARKAVREAGCIAGLDVDRKAPLRVLVWQRRGDAEKLFLDGCAKLPAHAKLPVLVTSGDQLPLWLPAGTEKKAIRSGLGTLVSNLDLPIFLTPEQPTTRRRLFHWWPPEGNSHA